MDLARQKVAVALLSVVSNAVLVALKLVAGLLIGSVSIVSEAIHSGVDLLAAVIAFLAVRASGRPADPEHPFGHGKFEDFSGMIEALLIFGAAIWIVWEAVHKLLHPTPLDTVGWGVAVMAVSMVANILVSRALFRVGKATESVALLADAWHLRTDVWTSAGVLVGLTSIAIGRVVLPGVTLDWIDPAVAIAVALLICKAAWDLTSRSVRDLLDGSLPADEQAWIRTRLSDAFPEVRSIHRLRTRRSGPERFTDFHLVVQPGMTVEAAHRISDDASALIRERFRGASVMVHLEPCDGTCSAACQGGCRLPPSDRPGASRAGQ